MLVATDSRVCQRAPLVLTCPPPRARRHVAGHDLTVSLSAIRLPATRLHDDLAARVSTQDAPAQDVHAPTRTTPDPMLVDPAATDTADMPPQATADTAANTAAGPGAAAEDDAARVREQSQYTAPLSITHSSPRHSATPSRLLPSKLQVLVPAQCASQPAKAPAGSQVRAEAATQAAPGLETQAPPWAGPQTQAQPPHVSDQHDHASLDHASLDHEAIMQPLPQAPGDVDVSLIEPASDTLAYAARPRFLPSPPEISSHATSSALEEEAGGAIEGEAGHGQPESRLAPAQHHEGGLREQEERSSPAPAFAPAVAISRSRGRIAHALANVRAVFVGLALVSMERWRQILAPVRAMARQAPTLARAAWAIAAPAVICWMAYAWVPGLLARFSPVSLLGAVYLCAMYVSASLLLAMAGMLLRHIWAGLRSDLRALARRGSAPL